MKDLIQVGCTMYNLVGFKYLAMVLKIFGFGVKTLNLDGSGPIENSYP